MSKKIISFLFCTLFLAANIYGVDENAGLESISLDQTSLTMPKGMSFQLTVYPTPSNVILPAINWASADPSVASVSSKGVVKAVGLGTTTITASTDNGQNVTCEVSVCKGKFQEKNGFRTSSAYSIGDGFPFNMSGSDFGSEKSTTATLYPYYEIAQQYERVAINSISYCVANNIQVKTDAVKIFFGRTKDTQIDLRKAGFFHDLTLVYSGKPILGLANSSTTSGYQTFNLAEPFVMDGTESLIVVVVSDKWDTNSGTDNTKKLTYYYEENQFTTNRSIRSNTIPSDYSEESFKGLYWKSSNQVPVTEFDYTTMGYCNSWSGSSEYSGGDGTVTNPYLISNIQQFHTLLSNTTNGTDYHGVFFKLTCDLQYNSTTKVIPTGGAFAGNLDGDGHIIVSKERFNKYQSQYFFQEIKPTGCIHNVAFIDFPIPVCEHNNGLIYNSYCSRDNTTQSTAHFAIYNDGRIENCVAKGSYTTDGTYGIAVYNNASGQINNCLSRIFRMDPTTYELIGQPLCDSNNGQVSHSFSIYEPESFVPMMNSWENMNMGKGYSAWGTDNPYWLDIFNTVYIPIDVTSLSLNKTSVKTTPGNSESLNVAVYPQNASDYSLAWESSNTSVATVSSSGMVTTIAAGTADITVTSSNGTSTFCSVTVANPVISISLSKSTLNLIKGNTSTLTVTYNPTDAEGKSVTWKSSNTSVATVSTSGLITAIASGTATITATSTNGKTATCTVTVTNPVSSISLNQASLNLTKGGTSTLTVTYNPADADSRSVTWKSSNTSVATVSSSGKVTAVASGTATITATSANVKTATCTVTVTNPVSSISLNQASLNLTKGGTSTLTVTYNPTDADSRSVTWKSSNTSVATVSTSGLVTAVASGTATITATSANGKTATCSVTVTNPVETVTLSETSIYLLAGDEQKIEATCTPIDADDCTITWSSSNNNVAVVDTEGNVTAKAAGSATITATSVNGKTATCTVSVTTEVVLTDGENYTQNKHYDCLDVTYTRTYTAGVWAAWYVPFDVVIDEDLLSKFEFAKLSGVLYEDNEWYIGAVKLKAGETVKALVPYLVKAKSSGEQTITAENTPLHAAADNGFSITSAENVFTFTGNCKAKTSSATDVGWYAMSTNGGFTRITKTGATMKGGRFFMTIADRSDNPYATSGAAASNFIRIREMGEATDVEEMMEMPVDETIYDLSGRRVDEPTESGIYIMNGKKIVIK